ncbi:MAG: hypothetical protein ACLGSH_02290 [Acidobacteriota bacterium]
MVYANTATLPLTPDVLELMETHQKLVGDYGTVVREEDSYSLAQPSPLKFVPSIASGDIPIESGGE